MIKSNHRSISCGKVGDNGGQLCHRLIQRQHHRGSFRQNCLKGTPVGDVSVDNSQRGSVLPLVAAILAASMIPILMTITATQKAVRLAEAQSAADAAALAGLAEGRPGAQDLATRNGASLVLFVDNGNQVIVEVLRDGVNADAAASIGIVRP